MYIYQIVFSKNSLAGRVDTWHLPAPLKQEANSAHPGLANPMQTLLELELPSQWHDCCYVSLKLFILIKTSLPSSSDSLVSALPWLEIYFNEGKGCSLNGC